jgi:hypothetical protein
MRVQKKQYELNPETFEVRVYYKVVDIEMDIFTGEGNEKLNKIREQNTITDILLSKFLQENPIWRVVEDRGESHG